VSLTNGAAQNQWARPNRQRIGGCHTHRSPPLPPPLCPAVARIRDPAPADARSRGQLVLRLLEGSVLTLEGLRAGADAVHAEGTPTPWLPVELDAPYAGFNILITRLERGDGGPRDVFFVTNRPPKAKPATDALDTDDGITRHEVLPPTSAVARRIMPGRCVTGAVCGGFPSTPGARVPQTNRSFALSNSTWDDSSWAKVRHAHGWVARPPGGLVVLGPAGPHTRRRCDGFAPPFWRPCRICQPACQHQPALVTLAAARPEWAT